MSELCSLRDLYNYTLRALGSPVINIEIDETQGQDRLNDVIQQFILRHYDGVEELYLACPIDAATVSRGYIQLDPTIVAVPEVFRINSGSGSGEEFERLNFLLKDTDIFDALNRPGVTSNFYMSRMKINLLQDILNPLPRHEYNGVTGRLYWRGSYELGGLLFLRVYKAVDADEFDSIYNNEWIKRASIAHIKKQWGTNLKKFSGVQMAGGIELNGQQIFDEAMEEIRQLDEEFSLKYEAPVQMFVG